MNSATANIVANGQSQAIALPATLGQFLAAKGWKPTQVVVELNGQVVPRPDVADHPLADGDRVEVIVPVAGG